MDFWQPALVAGCVLLAACGASENTDSGISAPLADPVFSADGIGVGATGMEIGFGRAEPGAIAAMSKLMGRDPEAVAQGCSGLRVARWTDGTTLYFEQRPYDPAAFVGWRTERGSAGRTCGA